MLGKENLLVSVAETKINQTPINKRLVRLVWESRSTKETDDNLFAFL